MSTDIKRRILVKALAITGNRHRLAHQVGATLAEVDIWLEGATEIPEQPFLRAMDVCLDKEGPSLWSDREPGDFSQKLN